MNCEAETARALRAAGLKITPQRVAILAALPRGGQQVTASDILATVKRSFPWIEPSTVYRTLSMARESGLVAELHLPSSDIHFEWTAECDRHHHLVCRVCGKTALLDSGLVDDLRSGLLERAGFAGDLHHLALTGVCRECLGTKNARAAEAFEEPD